MFNILVQSPCLRKIILLVLNEKGLFVRMFSIFLKQILHRLISLNTRGILGLCSHLISQRLKMLKVFESPGNTVSWMFLILNILQSSMLKPSKLVIFLFVTCPYSMNRLRVNTQHNRSPRLIFLTPLSLLSSDEKRDYYFYYYP